MLPTEPLDATVRARAYVQHMLLDLASGGTC